MRWRFVNQSNPSEVVVVHDHLSAQNLAQLLQKMSGDWIMQEERPLMAVMAKPEAVQSQPAPVEAVSEPVLAPQSASTPVSESVHVPVSEPAIQAEEPSSAAVEVAAVQIPAEAPVEAAPAPQRRAPQPPPPPKKAEKRDRRTQQRFMTEFRVILISGSSSFRTMSQDVSLGGMRLKKTVPESFLKEKCIAYVSHKDLSENIEIVCHIVGDPSDPCRIRFIQPNQTQIKRLSDWLVEHNQPLLNRGKAAS